MDDTVITAQALASSFGEKESNFDKATRLLIDRANLRVEEVKGSELEELMVKIQHRIATDSQVIGAPERRQTWQAGWKENLDELVSSGGRQSSLIPKFIRPGQPIRWRQNFFIPEDPYLELTYVAILRSWCAHKFFAHVANVFEFGCGTGLNLVEFSKLFPHKKYHGSDFVESAVAIVSELSRNISSIVSADVFDMLRPDSSYRVPSDSGVFTSGSLEQLRGDIDPIFDYFLQSGGEIFVHIEPEADFYDQGNPVDMLAYRFQTKRGYTHGIAKKLRELEATGRIQVLEARRLYFGSLYMEGYNLFVWRPTGRGKNVE